MLCWASNSICCVSPRTSRPSPLQADHLVAEHLQPPACLEVDPSLQALRVSACNSANPYQKWQFGNYYAD